VKRTLTPLRHTSRRLAVLLAAAFLVLHLVVLLSSISEKSATVDEFVHVPAGCWYWKSGDFTVSGLNPPLLKLWCALPVMGMKPKLPIAADAADRDARYPWLFGRLFLFKNWDHYDAMLTRARLAVMLLSLAGGVVLYLWTRRTFGTAVALLALGLFAVEPNVVAHGRLATQDTGMMLTFLLTLLFLDGLIMRGGWWRAVLVGISLGLASLVKFSGLVVALVPPVVFLVWIVFVRDVRFNLRVPGQGWFHPGRRRASFQALVLLLVIGVVALLFVNLPYRFAGCCRRLDADEAKSARMKQLAGSALGRVPMPLPRDYLAGLDKQQLSVERGETVNYLNGRWSETGWWTYYLEAFLLKVPVPVLVLTALGVVSVFVVRPPRSAAPWVMLVAGVLFWAAHSFGSNKNIGFRYVLPVLPLVLVLGARSLLLLDAASPRIRKVLLVVIVLLTAWTAVESGRIHPHYLAYFNQIAGGPSHGGRFLLDSNIDWGQDLKGLAAYLKREEVTGPVYLGYFGHVDPALYGIKARRPYPGVRGLVAVSLNYVRGMRYAYPQSYFDWLKTHEPVAVIGHTIYVYRTDLE